MIFLKNARLFIGWIHEIIRVGIRNRGILRAYIRYIENGVYKNSLRGDYIYEKNHKTDLGESTFSSLIHFNKYIDPILLFLVNLIRYRINDEQEKQFSGTEVIVSSSETEVKIFSSHQQEIITFYKELSKVQVIINAKVFFGKFYNTPTTLEYDYDKKYIREKFVKHFVFNKTEAFFVLCDKMKFMLLSLRNNLIYNVEDDLNKVSRFERIVGKSNLLKTTIGYPKVLTHGDFWSSNIIYDGVIYYLTDFERKDIRYFLFDFYCYIFSEYFLLNDDGLLMSYFKGDLDSTINPLCSAVGVDFNSGLRESFFLSFLVDISYERWSEEQTRSVANDLIKKYIPYYYIKD